MSDLQKAVENLRKFGRTMRPIIEVANALEQVAALDQHLAELQKAVGEGLGIKN